ISEKILRYHEALGHEVMHASADGEGLNEAQHRESLELFQSDVAPIIRAAVPSRPLEPVFSHAKRSEEHTFELQSRFDLVCRVLLLRPSKCTILPYTTLFRSISEKILRYHEALGHEVMHASADGEGLNEAQHRESLELFQSDVAPIIRAAVPSRPLEPVFSHAK